MFKSLRIKLTLINIIVLGLILTFVFSGIYILMARGMMAETERTMRLIAMQSKIAERAPEGLPRKHIQGSFYVRKDRTGNITVKSQNIPVDDGELDILLEKTEKQSRDEGDVKINNEAYRFLKSFSPDKKSLSIVYLNIQREKEFLTRLATIFIIIGLGSMGLAFFGSLFLADKALIPIKEAWEKQKSFVADASHELRTPLSSIRTNLEVVLDNTEESVESQRKWLNNILFENKRMSKLVDDLLLLARADSKQEDMIMVPFSLDRAIAEAVSPLEPIAAKKDIEIDMQLHEHISIVGDESHIKQLIVILVDNAIKYSAANGLVEVELNNHSSYAEILVSDTGEGIKEEEKAKIFERFYRVDKARSRESGGSGLGLSIAQWIAREHGGSISVSSGKIKGSVFKVTLPKNQSKKRKK